MQILVVVSILFWVSSQFSLVSLSDRGPNSEIRSFWLANHTIRNVYSWYGAEVRVSQCISSSIWDISSQTIILTFCFCVFCFIISIFINFCFVLLFLQSFCFSVFSWIILRITLGWQCLLSEIREPITLA